MTHLTMQYGTDGTWPKPGYTLQQLWAETFDHEIAVPVGWNHECPGRHRV